MTKTITKKPHGRPPVEIDIELLENLARIFCTIEDATGPLKVSKRTLMRYLDPEYVDPSYREAWERGQAMARVSLRRLQWKHANEKGSSGTTMTIHMSKHHLGETDKSALEVSGPGGDAIKHQVTNARDIIAGRIAGIAAKRGAEPDPAGDA